MTAKHQKCWMIALCLLTALTVGACSSAPTVAPRPSSTQAEMPASSRPGNRAAGNATQNTISSHAMNVALSMVGAPYAYGGSTPDGFDCSGLVYYSFATAGISVPRTTSQQHRGSRDISMREIREGDLLFFKIKAKADHVGIFIGDGRFVHAPSSGKNVTIGTLNDPFWRRSFDGARRIGR